MIKANDEMCCIYPLKCPADALNHKSFKLINKMTKSNVGLSGFISVLAKKPQYLLAKPEMLYIWF